MNRKENKWNTKKYQEYIQYLKSLKNEKYKQFQSKLVTTKYEILGISVPIQRKIAKEISQGEIISFLNIAGATYYEEVLIRGLVIASLKEKKVLLNYLEEYVLLVDNWAINDSFCSSLKIVNTEKEYWFSYFKKYLQDNKEYKIRIALVIFLNFYVEKNYLKQIFQAIDEITSQAYYVNMAIAWLLCECFIKYQSETIEYLKQSKINTFTFNKTISKIKDSYRVSDKEKKKIEYLKKKG